MLGFPVVSVATSFARRAVVAKVRAARDPEELAERTTALNGRLAASRRAIAVDRSVVELLDAAGEGWVGCE